MERIVALFEQESTGEKIRALLESAGVARVLCCRTAAEAKVLMGSQHIPTVVCGFKFSDGTAESLLRDLPEGRTMLLLARQDMLELCSGERMFRLATPLSRAALVSSATAALEAARRSARPARSPQDEAVIRRAKQWLMDRRHISEAQAHRLLQRRSMERGEKLSQTARTILEREAGVAIY